MRSFYILITISDQDLERSERSLDCSKMKLRLEQPKGTGTDPRKNHSKYNLFFNC